MAWGADIHIELFPMNKHTPDDMDEAAELAVGEDDVADDDLFHRGDDSEGADGREAVLPHLDWQGNHSSSESGYYHQEGSHANSSGSQASGSAGSAD